MKKIFTALTLLLIACAVTFAQPSAEKIIVTSDRGSCPLVLDGASLNVRDLLNNIESRLRHLQLLTLEKPELRRELQPVISELAALVALFPQEVQLVPVDVTIVKAVDNYTFDFIIVKLAETDDAGRLQFLRSAGIEEFYSMKQIGEIVELFETTQNKFEAVRILRSNIIDPENAWTVRDKFRSEEDGDRCVQIIFSWDD
ncbi:MAG TPA: DUF4476 domain-containing protein [candidate division Zixibacteria bacterium]|nr:DUF4476 domain-containing protein [candidate division Zixibacteria bacterium]